MIDDQPTSDNREDPIVVVGMGPGGLVAALESAKKGHKVVLIENREYFSRTQRVILDNRTIEYLKDLCKPEGKPPTDEDKQFMANIRAAGRTVIVSELQRFLADKVRNFPNNLIEVKQDKDVSVDSFDLERNEVVLSEGGATTRIRFKHVVAGDGARHIMSNEWSKAANRMKEKDPNLTIRYSDLRTQTRQQAHGTVSLQWTGMAPPDFSHKRDLRISDLPRLQALGWDQPYLPQCYLFSDHTHTKFYVAGEIPQSILDLKASNPEEGEKQLIAWGQLIMELRYQISTADTKLDVNPEDTPQAHAENKLKATAFPVTLQYAENPCVQLQSGSVFACVGDAHKNANFHLGHGVNDAIGDGINFAESLPSASVDEPNQSFDLSEYQMKQTKSLKLMTDKMKVMESDQKFLYHQNLGSLAEKITQEGEKLIEQIRALYPNDRELKHKIDNFKESFNSEDINFDDVYLRGLELAESLDQRLMEDYVISTKQQTNAVDNELDQVKQSIEEVGSDLTRHRESKANPEFKQKLGLISSFISFMEKIGFIKDRVQSKLEAKENALVQKQAQLNQVKNNLEQRLNPESLTKQKKTQEQSGLFGYLSKRKQLEGMMGSSPKSSEPESESKPNPPKPSKNN